MENNMLMPQDQHLFQIQNSQPVLVYQQPMVEGPLLPFFALNIHPININLPGHPLQHHYNSALNGFQQVLDKDHSGFQQLDGQNKIIIKQKFGFDGTMLGCESQNTHSVYASNQGENTIGSKLFKCTEKSKCCSKNFLSSSCQPFHMVVSILHKGSQESRCFPFLVLDKPCQCSFLCFNRPYVTVTLVEDGKNEYLGKITEPYPWCQMELRVYDKDDNHKYTIQENTCLLGLLSDCPVESSCLAINFDIKTASGGDILSSLQKKSSRCLKAGSDEIDAFVLNFPDSVTADDKALLMSAALFLDYQNFDGN